MRLATGVGGSNSKEKETRITTKAGSLGLVCVTLKDEDAGLVSAPLTSEFRGKEHLSVAATATTTSQATRTDAFPFPITFNNVCAWFWFEFFICQCRCYWCE